MVVIISSVILPSSDQEVREEHPDQHNHTAIDDPIVPQRGSYQHEHCHSNIEEQIARLIAQYTPA